MHVRRFDHGCVALAPAKLNLFLEVRSRRADGFHEIETLMAPIRLFDTLCVEERPARAIEFHLAQASSLGYPESQRLEACATIPADESNLVVRALQLLQDRCGINRGAKVHLIKRIPVAAGLGGGSSDAAAALVAGNSVWRLGLSRDELAKFAAQLGSDVPFFLGHGMAVCRGRGEQIEPLDVRSSLHVVVVRPPDGLSTAEVYRRCQPPVTPTPVEPAIAALQSGDTARLAQQLHNRLQAASEQLSPWINRLRDEFAATNCLGHQMSGSGSAYFALCRHARQAQTIAARLRAKRLGQVFATSTC